MDSLSMWLFKVGCIVAAPVILCWIGAKFPDQYIMVVCGLALGFIILVMTGVSP